jgi:hypothetical protein
MPLGRKSHPGRMSAIISQLPFCPNLSSILRSPILEVPLLSAPLQPLPSFSLFFSFVTANAEFFVHNIENNLNTHWPLAEATSACAPKGRYSTGHGAPLATASRLAWNASIALIRSKIVFPARQIRSEVDITASADAGGCRDWTSQA